MPPEHGAPPWVIPWNSEGLSNESVRRSVELASMAFDERFDAPDPRHLREDLRHRDTGPLRRRRAIVALSLIGLAGAALVSLYQMGMVRYAPDRSLRRLPADGVHASLPAYQHGVPDGILSLASHAVNLVMAGLGPEPRGRRSPWVPLTAAGKAAVEAGLASRYLLLPGPVVERSFYSMADAVARLAVFLLAIPEALDAVRHGAAADPTERRGI